MSQALPNPSDALQQLQYAHSRIQALLANEEAVDFLRQEDQFGKRYPDLLQADLAAFAEVLRQHGLGTEPEEPAHPPHPHRRTVTIDCDCGCGQHEVFHLNAAAVAGAAPCSAIVWTSQKFGPKKEEWSPEQIAQWEQDCQPLKWCECGARMTESASAEWLGEKCGD